MVSLNFYGTRLNRCDNRSLNLALAVTAGVALAAAFLVDHGGLAALRAQVADFDLPDLGRAEQVIAGL